MNSQTETPAAPLPAGWTQYHYVLTVQIAKEVTATHTGTLDVSRDGTRAQCLKHLMDQVQAKYGQHVVVLFFSLEPNALGAR
ncbi:hypothetical protein ACFV3R_15020 [Streptomyces sp. NPDC059740]|uniref:hypothetical protein n=1 Tax=Streptomyces sp. NPDC059740 TaxID=3346926 RepID=UPI003659ABFD